MIAPKDVYKVMGALRRHFDYIVVDTPAQLSEIVLAAFDHSTHVLCMVTLDLPSAQHAGLSHHAREVADQQRDDRGGTQQGGGRRRYRAVRCARRAGQQNHFGAPVLPGGHEVDQQGPAGVGLGCQQRHRQEAGRRYAAVPLG